MKTKKRLIFHEFSCIALTILIFGIPIFGIAQNVEVKKLPFSSPNSDEFSPVISNDGLIFCSNQRDNSLIGYYNGDDRIYKIFYASKRNNRWKTPSVYPILPLHGSNQGPATFNKAHDIVFFSQNYANGKRFSNIRDSTAKLGIYSAELIDGTWQNIRPFAYNNPLYILTTPALTPDGSRLFFSSDIPGGLGGMDLYYCTKQESGWSKPQNMGANVNTPGNDCFPYADAAGRLYFASDGLQGLGGLDLYFTLEGNGGWLNPTRLDSVINSSYDDFGIVLDSISQQGYFSSNRFGSDDIFYFKAALPDFTTCDSVTENNYCYTFYDERFTPGDTIKLNYKWDFGNGTIVNEIEAKHCFPGPGSYKVYLTITDPLSNDTVSHVVYPVNLPEPMKPYINSVNVGLTGTNILFDASSSKIPGQPALNCLWDFGEGFEFSLFQTTRRFAKQGTYTVRLGLQATGNNFCIIKDLRIYDAYQIVKSTEQTGISEIRVLLMDDLSSREKSEITKIFQTVGSIYTDGSNLHTAMLPYLEKASFVLNQFPEIRLEIMISNLNQHSGHDSVERLVRETGFYFKSEGYQNRVSSRKVVKDQLISVSDVGIEKSSIAELVFMKR